MKGSLQVQQLETWWADALLKLGAFPLLLQAEHINMLQTLQPHHKDPFDRILIAQAIAENHTLISMDQAVQHYSEAGLHVIS